MVSLICYLDDNISTLSQLKLEKFAYPRQQLTKIVTVCNNFSGNTCLG